MRLLGAILAGGRSSRFGSDKALALLDGEPLVAHVARALEHHVDATILCGRGEPVAGLAVVPDRPRAGLGPLGGLCGALHHAAAHGYMAVLSAGCDMPLLPAELLMQLTTTGGAAYFANAPVLGLWPATLATRLEQHLHNESDRSIRGWAAGIGAARLEAGVSIPNLNRPEDLASFSRAWTRP